MAGTDAGRGPGLGAGSGAGLGSGLGTDSRRVRLIAAVMAALALVSLVACSVLLAGRVREHIREHRGELHAFRHIKERSFQAFGRPVEFTDEFVEAVSGTEGAPGRSASWTLVVRYGDAAPLRLPVNPDLARNRDLPGLAPYNDFLRVLTLTPFTGRTLEDTVASVQRGDTDVRVMVVTLNPPPGVPTETWGRVWNDGWTFDFHELMPDGTITHHERLRFPTTSNRRRNQPGPGELVPGTWQYQAALLVMPAGRTPTIKYIDSPLQAAGWTFPAAVLSVFVLTAGVLLAAAPPRRTRALPPAA